VGELGLRRDVVAAALLGLEVDRHAAGPAAEDRPHRGDQAAGRGAWEVEVPAVAALDEPVGVLARERVVVAVEDRLERGSTRRGTYTGSG